MQKTILLITLLLGTAAGLFTSCYDDEGNYDYTILDEVAIDTTGCHIPSSWTVQRYDRIAFEPTIYYDGEVVNNNENAPLDYVWTLYTSHTGGMDYVNDTIGYSPSLDAEITVLSGTYTLQLTVTQRETGVQEYFNMQCSVEESITSGWMLLYERANEPGTSDVGLVVNSLVKNNITTAQEREFWDLYSASNQEPLPGTPVRILRPVVSLGGNTDPVICLTTEDIVRVNNASFHKIGEFESFFFDAPEVKAPTWIGTSGRLMNKQIMINDNKIYTVNYAMGTNNYMGSGKSTDYGKLAPWASDVTMLNDAVVYDQTNKRFYHIVQYTTNVTPFEAQSPTAEFDVNNVGATMLAADWGKGDGVQTGYDYFLMGNGNNRYLAIANFNGNATDTNVGLGWHDITNSPGIADATTIASALIGEYIFYGSGNKVYRLQYNSSDMAQALWEAPSADEVVTCIRMQKYYYLIFMQIGVLPNSNAIVHIATWNESTKEGKLYQYPINPATGELSGEPRVYTVPGKVGDMAWKYEMPS